VFFLRLAAVAAVTIASTFALPAPGQGQGQGSETFDQVAGDSGYTNVHANAFRLYWAALDRTPDAGGARYWAQQIDSCVKLQDIAAFFAASAEFQLRYGQLSDDDYVQRIYNNVLARDPDAAGYAYWTDLLAKGDLDRGGILLYFSLSQEFVNGRPLPSTGRADSPCGPLVTRIVDGDTLEVDTGERIRIIGIDAPEGGACFANDATQRLATLAPVGTAVRLVSDTPTTDNRDRFGRSLRFVEVAGVDVGRVLLAEGLVSAYPFDGGSTRAVDYDLVESEARFAAFGFWSVGAGVCVKDYPPVNGSIPAPPPSTPPPPTPPTAACHPAYASPCLPIVSDLDCGDIGQVVFLRDPANDPYRLDGRGNKVGDGVGCESYG